MFYPEIDPVLISLGPLAIRWYGISYLAAFGVTFYLGQKRAKLYGWNREELSDLIFYGAIGVVLGGRLGFTLFYGFESLVADPLFLFRIWEGGMSFHGGLLGVMIAIWWFAKKTSRTFFSVGDYVAPLVPIGLGFGRLGNFANTELPGRFTDAPWALFYPCKADSIRSINQMCYGAWEEFARHPSSIYQAVGEGLILFIIVMAISRQARRYSYRRDGYVSGAFLAFYGAIRFCTEFFREPDPGLGLFVSNLLTMGQLLSIPMLIIGILLMFRARKVIKA